MISQRRIWQMSSVFALNLPLIGPWFAVCVPVLNCHSCPWAVFSCPIGILGHFAAWMTFPFLALGVIVLLGGVFGRILCGWICPIGFLQDLLHKIPSPKFTLPRWTLAIKYILLVGSVILVPMLFGLESYAFYCRLCPAGTLESLLPRALSAGDYAALSRGAARIVVLAVILILAVFSLRSFCKALCPIGAFLAIFNRVSAFSLRYDQEQCPVCEQCLQGCPMDVRIGDFRQDGASEVVTAPSECILCLSCTHKCQQSGLRFSLWNLLPRRRERDTIGTGKTV